MEPERDRKMSAKISARAYELWEEGGRKDGDADAHWAQATREVGSAGRSTGTTSVSKPSTSKPSTSKPPAGPKDSAKAPAAKAKKPTAPAGTSAKT